MTSVPIYNGSDDVLGWIIKIKAKLISKGYKSVLTDSTRPAAADARTAWNALADKAQLCYVCLLKWQCSLRTK